MPTVFDVSLVEIPIQLWLMVFVGILSGTAVILIIKLGFRRRSSVNIVPTLPQRGIRYYLLTNYLLFAGIMFLMGVSVVFAASMALSTRMQIAQMAAKSNMASMHLTEFTSNLEDELLRFGSEGIVIGGDKATTARALGRLYRAAEHFQRVILVSEEETIVYAYPPEEMGSALMEQERLAVSQVLSDGVKRRVVSRSPDGAQMLSIVMPILSGNNQPSTILIGRVPSIELAKFLVIPGSGESEINSFIVDNDEQLIAQTTSVEPVSGWGIPTIGAVRNLNVPEGLGGQAFLSGNQGFSRDLVYIAPRTVHSWYVAMVVPFGAVLNQALFFTIPLVAIFLIVASVFYVRLDRYGRSLSAPISELAMASRLIAEGGNLTTRVQTSRQDEIGDLSHAFTGMQLALKGRLDELSLLLNVSQDISSSINITQSMPVILQGALRGTGAAGARVLIINPSGKIPLSFTEGPAGADLAAFDRSLMTLLRENKELALGSPRQMRAKLMLAPAARSPIKALYALPLQSNDKFQGIFFLGYRQVREFTLSERTLLRTLAGQASVLVDNAYLFANAEGGRRRLMAVLASTTEAFIVTDQTDRILVINRAMERAFQLTSGHVRGRSVGDVIESKQLVEALTQEKIGKLDLEIEGKNRRSYFVNVSPIIGQRGLVMGRVAVLHDVTHYKEIDRLKSDFVSNVSHDLRTPLTLMSGYAAALSMSEDLSSEQREYTDNIVRSVEHMTEMVVTLLDLARIEAGVDLMFEQIDIEAFLQELVEEHWLYAHEAGAVLQVKVSRDLPPVTADRTYLSQAVANLLTNGFKYAPNSGEMILSAEQAGDQVIIGLRDQGPGIAGQDQIRLFEKFYRVKRHGSGNVKGTGLGLGMVKSIADRHGGRVWCQSELGKGSTFYISLPLEQGDSQDSAG